MVDVPQCVLQDLRCHKCDQYLSRSPVYLDEQGTQICSQCYKPSVPATRNITYEAVAKLMRFPCRYHDMGCPVTIPFLPDNVEDPHEESCEYRPFHCPIMGSVGCPWIGIRSNMMEHCYTKHSDRVLNNPNSLSHDITKSSEKYFIIIGFGLVFLLKVKVCLKTDKIIYSIACLDNHTSRFQCSLDIKRYFNVISRHAELLPNEPSSVSVSISCMVDVFDGFDGTVFTFTIKEVGDKVSNDPGVSFGNNAIDCHKESNRNCVRDSTKPSSTNSPSKTCPSKSSRLVTNIPSDVDIVTPPKQLFVKNINNRTHKISSFQDTCFPKPKHVALFQPAQQPESNHQVYSKDSHNRKCACECCALSDENIIQPKQTFLENNNKKTYKINSLQNAFRPKPKLEVVFQSNINIGCPNEKCDGKRSRSVCDEEEILCQPVQQPGHEISCDENTCCPKPKDEDLSQPDDTKFGTETEKQKNVSTDKNKSICLTKERVFCKNTGCSYKDTSNKLWKHKSYFCPYTIESRCYICSKRIPKHSLHQHYAHAHNNITIPNGGTLRAVKNCTSHFFVCMGVYGNVIGWYSRKNKRFVLNLYSPLSSDELKKFRCTIKFKNDRHIIPNNASTSYKRRHPELHENYDWTMERSDFPEQIIEVTVNIDEG